MQTLKIILVYIVMAISSAEIIAQEISVTSDHYLTIDGWNIHYRTGGNGPVLLMLHGFTLSSEQWTEFFDEFAPHHTVIAVDLPGHGKSDLLGEPFHFDKWSDLMLKFLNELEIDSLSGIGHSAGAITLMKMAEKAPEKFHSLVLVAGAHRYSETSLELLLDDSFDKASEDLQNYYRGIHFNDMEKIESLFEDIRHMTRLIYKNPNHAVFSKNELEKLTVPALLVFGDRDIYFTIDIAAELHSLLPNSRLWVVPDKGHTPVWRNFGADEKVADIFPEVAMEFISED